MEKLLRALATASCALLAGIALAQDPIVLQQDAGGIGAVSSEFGAALAATSKHFWVGAPRFGGYGVADRGKVEAFFKNFTPDNLRAHIGELNSRYGTALSGYKSLIYIGYPIGAGGTYGGVVQYFNDAYTTAGVIGNPAPETEDNFGAAVATGARLTVIGAPKDVDGPSKFQCGAAFVSPKKAPNPAIRLTAPAYGDGDQIGYAVAVSADFIAVGAPGATGSVANDGSVYIYDATTYEYITTLQNFGVLETPRFGSSLVFAGNYLFVGAPNADKFISPINRVQNVGAVYQYDIKTWQAVRGFVSADQQENAHFGAAITADKKKLVVGSPQYDHNTADVGRVETFELKTGTHTSDLFPPQDTANQDYGQAVLILKGNRLAVGAPATDSATLDAGRVYIYKLAK